MSYLEIYLTSILLLFCICEFFVCLMFMRASQHLSSYFPDVDTLRVDKLALAAGEHHMEIYEEYIRYKHDIKPKWEAAKDHLVEFNIQKLYQLRHQIMEEEGIEDVKQRSA